MSRVWGIYSERMRAAGGAIRTESGGRETRNIETLLPNSLSYTEAVIFDGEHSLNITQRDLWKESNRRNVAVINSDNLDEKRILSMPGEDIKAGSLVWWMDNFWLVTERDANTTLYTRCKMQQCNYLLKWVAPDYTVCEQWCFVEDGTKYLTGEMEDRNFVVARGDSRIAISIGRNSKTMKLNRHNRFLVDDYDSDLMLAYQLTKPLKPGHVYNGEGIYKFVLQEVQVTKNDCREKQIADYYKYFNEDGSRKDPPAITGGETGREGWI